MVKSIYFEEVNIGDEIPELVKEPIPKVQMVKYAGASGDFHPLHTDDDLGRSLKMGGRIAHGMLVMGFVGEAITNWIPKKNLKKFNARFVGITKPGESITVTGKVVDKDEDNDLITCEITAQDQNEHKKIKGSFTAMLERKK